MFTHHFKMRLQPFCERTGIDQILKDERMNQGLSRLEFMAYQGTIALVTGPTGVGKSTLIKLFLNSLTPNRYRHVYLHLTQMRASSFLKVIVSALGESPKNTKDRVFHQILDKTRNSDLTSVLIIDESHLLSIEALTDLRLLVSSAVDENPPFKVLLVGQESLKNQLQRSCLMDLLQRINIRYHLPPLTKAQTISYLDFQMNACGSSEKVFDPDVKAAIHDYTHGIPRQINNAATACLLHAACLKSAKVTETIFQQAVGELQFS